MIKEIVKYRGFVIVTFKNTYGFFVDMDNKELNEDRFSRDPEWNGLMYNNTLEEAQKFVDYLVETHGC
jgi:hypothetical protein